MFIKRYLEFRNILYIFAEINIMRNDYYKDYYLKNSERIKERVRNYGKTHKDEIRQRRIKKKLIDEKQRIEDTIAEKERILNDESGCVWKDIKGFEGEYQMNENREIRKLPFTVTQIDGKGNVYTRKFNGGIIKQRVDSLGYLSATLNHKNYRIHWLYYNTFIGDSSGMLIDHIDRNKLNNDPSNLRLLNYRDSNSNRTLHFKPDITDFSKYYKKKHPNGSMSKPFLLRFSEGGKRKRIGYFRTYEEAENKYRELYNERQNRIDGSN